MALSKELKKKIEERLGSPLTYSADCERLAAAIEEATGERLGVTTIKRMFGFAGEQVEPRGTTMDIIAQYLGYDDMKDMTRQLGDASDISMFTPVDEINVSTLREGTQIQFTYDPDRLIVITYIGDFWFIINESLGSKLRKGDKIRLTQLAKGFELLISDVVRDSTNLGPYHAAKNGGLTSVEIIV